MCPVLFMATVIGYFMQEAPSHGLSILAYDPLSRGAQAYAALADEVLRGTAPTR